MKLAYKLKSRYSIFLDSVHKKCDENYFKTIKNNKTKKNNEIIRLRNHTWNREDLPNQKWDTVHYINVIDNVKVVVKTTTPRNAEFSIVISHS